MNTQRRRYGGTKAVQYTEPQRLVGRKIRKRLGGISKRHKTKIAEKLLVLRRVWHRIKQPKTRCAYLNQPFLGFTR